MDDPFPEDMMKRITTFFNEVHPKLKKGKYLYNEVFETEHFFPLQRRHETQRMIALASSIFPKTVMEIGADKGGSLYHWCMIPSVDKVIACEIRGTPYSQLFEKAFPEIAFLWLPVSSYANETVETVRGWLSRSTIDSLFLDGDKSYYDLDFDIYWEMISNPGFVFFHDIVDDIAPNHHFLQKCTGSDRTSDKIIDFTDGHAAYNDKVRNIAPKNSYWGFMQHWCASSMGVGVVKKGKSND